MLKDEEYLKRIEILESNIDKILNKNISLTKEIGELKEIVENQNLEIYKCSIQNQNLSDRLNEINKDLSNINTELHNVYDFDELYILIYSLVKGNLFYNQKIEGNYSLMVENLKVFKSLSSELDDIKKFIENKISNINNYNEDLVDKNGLIKYNEFSSEKYNENNIEKDESVYDIEKFLTNRNVVYATKKQRKTILKKVKSKNYILKEDIDKISKKDASTLIGYLNGVDKNVKKDFLDKYLDESYVYNFDKKLDKCIESVDINDEQNLGLVEDINITDENIDVIENNKKIVNLYDNIGNGYTPTAIQINEYVIKIDSNWNNAILKFNEYLYKKYKDDYLNIINSRKLKNIDKYISISKGKLEDPIQVCNSGVFLSKSFYHATITISFIKEIVEVLSIDASNISIHLNKIT